MTHRSTIFYYPLAVLFLSAAIISSSAQSDGVDTTSQGAEEGATLVWYEVKANLSLHCTLPNDKGLPYVWTKNGTDVENLWDVKPRMKLEEGGAKWSIGSRPTEDDWGNYSCSVGSERQAWAVRARSSAKLPDNTNVVEGQKLKLACRLVGKPYPVVSWRYRNASEGDNKDADRDVLEALGERVRLETSAQGVVGGVLVLEPASKEDAGSLSCVPEGGLSKSTVLRVKDMYAALWPFLGICLEVVILCAVILVYERRRTKPDLDDSDADDQKKS